jgi:uncharacterized membrane protein HdeD (DUF308 family)
MTTKTDALEGSPIKAHAMPWWILLLEGIALVIIGIMLLTTPVGSTIVLVQFLGIYWLVSGIFRIVSIFMDSAGWVWNLLGGIVGIAAGILIIQNPLWSALLVPTTLVVVIGLMGAFMGVTSLIAAFQGAGLGAGILGVLSILIGLYLAFNPLGGAIALPFVLGIFAVVGGAGSIIQAFRVRSA